MEKADHAWMMGGRGGGAHRCAPNCKSRLLSMKQCKNSMHRQQRKPRFRVLCFGDAPRRRRRWVCKLERRACGAEPRVVLLMRNVDWILPRTSTASLRAEAVPR